MALDFVSVDDKYTTFARIDGGVWDVTKEQPWIVAAYWSLEWQMSSGYVNSRQREGPAVRCMIIKIMEIMLKKRKYVEIGYKTDNIQLLCIKNVSDSTVSWHKNHVQTYHSDWKKN